MRQVNGTQACIGAMSQERVPATLEVNQGQILSQSTTDATQCHPILVAFVWELTKETINLPQGCLQGGAGAGERQDKGAPLNPQPEILTLNTKP